MASSFSMNAGAIQVSVPWVGRTTPMLVIYELPPSQINVVKDTLRRIKREPVQIRMMQHLGIGRGYINNISGVTVSPRFPFGHLEFDPAKKGIQLSVDEAQSLHGNKVAVVISGAIDRLFTHDGALLGLEEAGISYDYLLATSGGAIMATLRALNQGAGDVDQIAMGLAQKYSWHDVVDIDFVGLRERFSSFNGFIPGRRFMRIMREDCRIGDLGFADARIKLGIIGFDLDSCRTTLFGFSGPMSDELIHDPASASNDLYPKNLPYIYPDQHIRLVDAIRASVSMPGIFRVHPMSFAGREYSFVDGGVGENCAIRTAASIIDVGTIIAISLGFPEEKETPAYKTGLFRALSKTLDGGGDVQSMVMHDHKLLRGLRAVRVIKPGVYLESPKAFNRAQDIKLSGRETVRKILKVLPGDRLFRKLDETSVAQLRRTGLIPKVYLEDIENANVVHIRDSRPLIDRDPLSPEWAHLYEEDGGLKPTKKPAESDKDWIKKQLADAYGWRWLAYLAANGWILKKWFFKDENEKA